MNPHSVVLRFKPGMSNFPSKLGQSDWPQMGQIWDFLRSVSVHFGSASQNVLKLIFPDLSHMVLVWPNLDDKFDIPYLVISCKSHLSLFVFLFQHFLSLFHLISHLIHFCCYRVHFYFLLVYYLFKASLSFYR